MKKTVTGLLIIALVLSLFALSACSDDTKTAEPSATPNDAEETLPDSGIHTKVELEASKPNEYLQEKLDAGMEIHVAYDTINFDGVDYAINESLGAAFEEMGISYDSSTYEGDTAKQIQQIENYVTMGYACLMLSTNDPSGVEDCATAAENAGTSIIFYGTEPSYYCTGVSNIDLDQLGYGSGLIARAWIDQAYPDAKDGEIKVACMGYYVITETGWLSDAIRRAIADDPRCDTAYKKDDCLGVEAGYNSAEEAFTVNPDILVVASFDLNSAYGASNYIMTIPGVDPSKYCCVGTTANESMQDFLDQAKAGQGCFRGTTNGDDDPAAGLVKCFRETLLGGAERPHVVLETLQAKSSFDFDLQSYMDRYYTAEK